MAPSLKIAIIDDDQIVRRAALKLLLSFGYDAYAFPSAEAFLAEDVRDFACVITDVKMPGLSGLDLQRRLKGIRPDLAMIFMTAFADDRVRLEALNGGARHFIEKPCDPDHLIGCIETILSSL
jgi:FixJ family two-component response regulator